MEVKVSDAPAPYGGIAYGVKSSQNVTAYVSGNKQRQDIDRSLAVRADMDKQAEKMIHEKLKAALPGARFPSWW